MSRSVRTWFAVSMALLSGVVAACAGGAPAGSGSNPSAAAAAGVPQVVILSPPANAQVALGQPIDVVTTGVDAIGVGRIDLKVNDLTVSSAEAPPGGLTSFSAVHVWTPSASGPATLTVVAYRADGAPSDPMAISVLVLPAGASAAPYPTYGGAVPTYRASAVPGNYAQPTYKTTATYGTNPTYTANATYGTNPTYTVNPTYDVQPTYGATPTYVADPTYTAGPTDPIAPPDENHNWAIPYNGASEISDYVSYPTGDVEDRVVHSVSGIGNAPPNNIAHLIVFATCEGVGTEFITFQVGTAKFRCGEKIIDKEVNADTDVGTIRVFAFGGAYVKWTLNASAFAP